MAVAEAGIQKLELADGDFRRIAERVRAASGIVLNESKRGLVHGRLSRRLRTLGCRDFAAYLEVLDGRDGAAEEALLINAITTNLTGFFREKHHFDLLGEDILPKLVKATTRERLRVWSAGCSSGEEPYSIAMTMRHCIGDLDRRDALILATDIDSEILATAQAGIYEDEKAKSIPARYAQSYTRRDGGGEVEMLEPLKRLIRFRQLNLLGDWPMQGPFDVIFCRNVVIYFDKDAQRELFDRYAELLRPNGWLFIGHSESLFRVSDRFRHLGHTAYQKTR